MHLVLLSNTRTGSKMLRSMLRAGPNVADLGTPFVTYQRQTPDAPESEGWGSYLDAHADDAPIVLSNLKVGAWFAFAGWQDAAATAHEHGARFVTLRREDTLAEACSWALAMAFGGFMGIRAWEDPDSGYYGQQPTITPDPAVIRQDVADRTAALAELDALVADWPHADLVYEHLSPDYVADALATLGIAAAPGWPTTQKIAPPLADYVANLAEVRAALA